MVNIFEIIQAIEREDMIEAHRLVRQRKEERERIKAEMAELAPKIFRSAPTPEVMERQQRAFGLFLQGEVKEARAMLEEDMTPEEVRFGELLAELLGFPVMKRDLPRTEDMVDAERLIAQAFGQQG